MKAKKIVRIELKNPALRRIRKNFRDLIEHAVKHESSRLFAKSCEYRKRSRESIDHAEKERLEQKEDKFRNKSNELDSSLSKSIIQCGLGVDAPRFQEQLSMDSIPTIVQLTSTWLGCPLIMHGSVLNAAKSLSKGIKFLERKGTRITCAN